MSNLEAPRFPLINPNSAATYLVRRLGSESHAFAAQQVCIAKDDKSNKFVQLGSATQVLRYLNTKEVNAQDEKPSIEDGFAIGYKGEPGPNTTKNYDDTGVELQLLRQGFADGSELVFGPYIKPTLVGQAARRRGIDKHRVGIWVAREVFGPDWTIVS